MKFKLRSRRKFSNVGNIGDGIVWFVIACLVVGTDDVLAKMIGRQPDFDDTNFGDVPMYFTFRSAVDAFAQERQHDTSGHAQLAQFILTTFETQCLVKPNVKVKAKVRKPFITIESNHLSTRTIMARRFTRRIGGIHYRNPPVCLVHLKQFFPSSNPLVSAYYTLGMYAVSFKATVAGDFKPVVTTGYWYDKASFWLNLNCANTTLPPISSSVYDFPTDLKVPDLTFYLNFPDDVHRRPSTTRSPSNWKPRMLQIIRMLRGVPMIELNSRMGFDNLLIAMENITTEILGKTRDFKFS